MQSGLLNPEGLSEAFQLQKDSKGRISGEDDNSEIPRKVTIEDRLTVGSENWALLSNLREEHQVVLSASRVLKEGETSKAVWDARREFAMLTVRRGSAWHGMGRMISIASDHREALHALYPEEALFLLEMNALELSFEDLPLSLQRAYTLLCPTKRKFQKYRVYSALARAGLRVLRWENREKSSFLKEQNLRNYEKKLKLNSDWKSTDNLQQKFTGRNFYSLQTDEIDFSSKKEIFKSIPNVIDGGDEKGMSYFPVSLDMQRCLLPPGILPKGTVSLSSPVSKLVTPPHPDHVSAFWQRRKAQHRQEWNRKRNANAKKELEKGGARFLPPTSALLRPQARSPDYNPRNSASDRGYWSSTPDGGPWSSNTDQSYYHPQGGSMTPSYRLEQRRGSMTYHVTKDTWSSPLSRNSSPPLPRRVASYSENMFSESWSNTQDYSAPLPRREQRKRQFNPGMSESETSAAAKSKDYPSAFPDRKLTVGLQTWAQLKEKLKIGFGDRSIVPRGALPPDGEPLRPLFSPWKESGLEIQIDTLALSDSGEEEVLDILEPTFVVKQPQQSKKASSSQLLKGIGIVIVNQHDSLLEVVDRVRLGKHSDNELPLLVAVVSETEVSFMSLSGTLSPASPNDDKSLFTAKRTSKRQ